MAQGNGTHDSLDLQGIFQEKEGLKAIVEAVVQRLIEQEAEEHVGAGRYERTEARRGYRNGKRSRRVKTRVGEVSLEVPQVRDSADGPYQPSMLLKWQRSERALLVSCAEMYFQGVSTRAVQSILEQMGAAQLSAGQVSRIAADLDKEIDTLRQRRLAHTDYPYLMIDARYEKIRRNGHIVSQAVLITVGIDLCGRREVLDWRVADSESEQSWSDVFRDLKDRQLRGVRLVISDAHTGIRGALERQFQGVAWQRCRVHFIRNLLNKGNWNVRKTLAQELRDIWRSEEVEECLRRAEDMACRWEERYPKIATMLRTEVVECLTVHKLPAEHRHKLYSTNMLERQMQELKKRTAVVSIFPNAASCERLIGARLVELHEKWAAEPRRYLRMEPLEQPEYQDVFEGIGLT